MASLRVGRDDPRYVNVTAKVYLDGGFFTRDPGKTLRANVRDMLDGLAAEMEKEVKGIIGGAAGAMPGYTGWSYQHTKGYTTSGITGHRWQTWAAVTADTSWTKDKKPAQRTKAAAASIEKRFHPYRRVKSAVYRLRPVLSANLTRNLE
jgi:hypothetical protein